MRPFNSSLWLTGHCDWSFGCALISIFAITGYYADLLRRLMPEWAAVAVLLSPITIILFVQWGEAPDRVVAVSHIVATAIFTLFALGMELASFLGYQPEGAGVYRLLAHLGWTFAWAGIYRRARVVSEGLTSKATPHRILHTR